MLNIVTLMMVCYNRVELTKRTIDNIYKTAGIDFNLVIIDNGSNDESVEYLKSIRLKNTVLVLNNQNKGIAIGRNQALLEADKLNTNFYCTIDNDVEPPMFWLRDGIELLMDNHNYGAFGVNYEPTTYPLVKSKIKDLYFQNKPTGNLGTATMIFRKQLHQMIGFFNTEYGIYGLEDSDFGMRARVANFKLGYLEKMGIHLGSDESDLGEYRKFKTKEHDDHLEVFKRNCGLYTNNKKPIYIPFKDSK